MRIHVNGEIRAVQDKLSLQELVTHLELSLERLAIELNQDVARRSEWPKIILQEDDRVEIVHFVGGGEDSGRRREQTAANSSLRLNPK